MKAILSSVSLSLCHTHIHTTHTAYTHRQLPQTPYTYTAHTIHTHTHHIHILMGNGGRDMTEIHYSAHEIVKK